MKNNIIRNLALGLSLSLPSLVIAQGTYLADPANTNNHALVVAPGGNIGIGKLSSGSKLDVAGDIHASDFASFGDGHWGAESVDYTALSTFGGAVLRGNSINVGGLTVGGWNKLAPVSGLWVGANALFMSDVGIGTTNPATALHIPNRGIQIGTSTKASENFHLATEATGAAASLRFWNGNYGAGTFLATLGANGSFGLGVLTPAAKLHVNGTAMIDLSSNGGGRLWFGSNPNDNRVYLEGFNAAGNDSAAEVVVSGYQVRALPKFSVMATESTFSGKVSCQVLELTSDRAAKAGFAEVDRRGILDKALALPVSTWYYTNSPSIRHLGPMAQDFMAAFGLGDSDKQISVVDGLGVALAAIQGLNDVVKEKDARIAALEKEVASLRTDMVARLASLEKQMAQSVPASASGSTDRPTVETSVAGSATR